MSGTTAAPEGITNPPIDALLDRVDSKYSLVIFGAKRARQINAYYSQLGEGLLENVGPMVPAAPEEKPLSIALREMEQGLLKYTEIDPNEEVATTEVDPAFTFVDPFATGEETDTTQA